MGEMELDPHMAVDELLQQIVEMRTENARLRAMVDSVDDLISVPGSASGDDPNFCRYCEAFLPHHTDSCEWMRLLDARAALEDSDGNA